MTSLNWDRFRGHMAVVLAVLVFSLEVRPARAADAGNQGAAPQTTDADRTSASDTDKPTTAEPTAETPAAPRLQIQDEGPTARSSDSVLRSRVAAADDTEDRPLWKNWIFWAVTGVLVVGAVSTAIYMSSGTDDSLAPCPPDVVVSLGCFGTGR